MRLITSLFIIYNFCIDKMDGFMLFDKLAEIDRPFKSKLNDDCNNINPATFNLWEGNKYKSNILKYKKDYDGYHPTQKPILLLEDLIKTFSNENDLVVDLTMGSGSTGVACKKTGRHFIGIEKDEKYFETLDKKLVAVMIESSFIFSCTWSLCVSVNTEYRKPFDIYFKKVCNGELENMP